MMTKSKVHEIADAIIKLRELATDEQAAEVPALYPEWKDGAEHEEGKRVVRDGKLYKVLKKHKGHMDHCPENDDEYFEQIGGKNEHISNKTPELL